MKAIGKWTDAELVVAYGSSHDEAAFEEIVARHGPMVYRVCLSVLGDPAEADDCTQAAFLVFVRKARSLRRGENVAAWLYGVARRICLGTIRARASRARREEMAAMNRRASQEEGTGGDSEIVELVCREMAALSTTQRQAIILRYIEGRSEKEAAGMAGCPQGTLGRRASEGLARLRERLGRRGRILTVMSIMKLLNAGGKAVMPRLLFRSILAAPETAATGAAAGTTGKVFALAEGAMKAMFWMRVKVVAAVVVGTAVVSCGGAVAVIAAAEPKAKPSGVEAITAKDGVECRVVEVGSGGKVKLSAGSDQGIKEKSECDVFRDAQLVGAGKVIAVGEKHSTAEVVSATDEIRVGDMVRVRSEAGSNGENPTAKFFGPEGDWGDCELRLDDVHGLWGGRTVTVKGSGECAVAVVSVARKQTDYPLKLEAGEVAELIRLCIRGNLTDLQMKERSGVPDEARPRITLRNSDGEEHSVAKWANDEVQGFDRVYEALLAIEKKAAGKP